MITTLLRPHDKDVHAARSHACVLGGVDSRSPCLCLSLQVHRLCSTCTVCTLRQNARSTMGCLYQSQSTFWSASSQGPVSTQPAHGRMHSRCSKTTHMIACRHFGSTQHRGLATTGKHTCHHCTAGLRNHNNSLSEHHWAH